MRVGEGQMTDYSYYILMGSVTATLAHVTGEESSGVNPGARPGEWRLESGDAGDARRRAGLTSQERVTALLLIS